LFPAHTKLFLETNVKTEGKIHSNFFQTQHGEQSGKFQVRSTIFVGLDTFFRNGNLIQNTCGENNSKVCMHINAGN
jgi:hypothetical protein